MFAPPDLTFVAHSHSDCCPFWSARSNRRSARCYFHEAFLGRRGKTLRVQTLAPGPPAAYGQEPWTVGCPTRSFGLSDAIRDRFRGIFIQSFCPGRRYVPVLTRATTAGQSARGSGRSETCRTRLLATSQRRPGSSRPARNPDRHAARRSACFRDDGHGDDTPGIGVRLEILVRARGSADPHERVPPDQWSHAAAGVHSGAPLRLTYRAEANRSRAASHPSLPGRTIPEHLIAQRSAS